MDAIAVKRGADVVVGDLLVFLGRKHRVLRFEDKVHPTHGPWRRAVCELDWSMAIYPAADIEVVAA